jgi:hypothetical protein
MQMKITFILSIVLSLMLLSCAGGGDQAAKTDTLATVSKKFPEPTDSTANGLHPFYPTEQNVLGKWILPDPIDTTPLDSDGYIEFLADHSMAVGSKYTLSKPIKWELNGNVLVITHESGDPLEKGRIFNDTLVLEAVSDTSVHYFNLHEPNFIMHLRRKK